MHGVEERQFFFFSFFLFTLLLYRENMKRWYSSYIDPFHRIRNSILNGSRRGFIKTSIIPTFRIPLKSKRSGEFNEIPLNITILFQPIYNWHDVQCSSLSRKFDRTFAANYFATIFRFEKGWFLPPILVQQLCTSGNRIAFLRFEPDNNKRTGSFTWLKGHVIRVLRGGNVKTRRSNRAV